MIRAAIYPRVSTKEQALSGYSITEQEERLRSYCGAMGWTVYGDYSDAGYSGGNMNRPGLQRLIADAQKHKIDKVVVYRLDRLSRSQKDALYLLEDVFLPNNVDFVSMSENWDTSSAFGRAMVGLLACFAQLEKETITERLMMGKEAKIRDGLWIGSVVPMGYNYTDGKLVINPDEAEIVKEMFSLYNAGVAMRNIETQFNDSGYTMRGRPIRLCSIRYMLDNKVYAGYLRTKTGWTKGLHEPIITEPEWQSAHDRLTENKERYEQYGTQTNGDRHSTLLGGLVYCGKCGARYGKRQVSSGRWQHYKYCCYSRIKCAAHMVRDPDCKNKMYRVEELDGIILDMISQLSIDADKLPKPEPADNDNEKITAAISRIDGQISRFLDLYGIGRISVEQLDAKIEPLAQKKAQLQAKMTPKTANTVPREQAIQTIKDFSSIVATGDRQQIRSVIETLINRIVIDDDNIQIEWRFT